MTPVHSVVELNNSVFSRGRKLQIPEHTSTDPDTTVVEMQVMQSYYSSSVPQPGEEFEFCPDASLQPVHYRRGRASEGLVHQYVHRAAIAAAEAEAGEGLGSWTVAALCRSLSLDNILLLLTGQLLCIG